MGRREVCSGNCRVGLSVSQSGINQPQGTGLCKSASRDPLCESGPSGRTNGPQPVAGTCQQL